MSSDASVFDAACEVLTTAPAELKAKTAQGTAADWRNSSLSYSSAGIVVPDRPARPGKPTLVAPAKMPRRRLGSVAGRVALLHAVAHIELNAIDLAFDMLARFGPEITNSVKNAFVADWIKVGDDEAKHFLLILNRLRELGSDYGALPAHDGLWEAAQSTQDDVLARLAVAPLVLEARGLDVTPRMIENLERVGDQQSADILKTIYHDEISHVAIGAKWLKQLAILAGYEPRERFRHFVTTRFNGALKEPFNHEARALAGFEQDFYLNITH